MQTSPFPYSDTNKRYHTYDYYLKHRYGTKCARIPIDAGFSCPNRLGCSVSNRGTDSGLDRLDGSGCIYCSARGSGDFCADALLPPAEQFARGYETLCKKWGKRLPAIPYFQAFSNTYAPLDTLKRLYNEALSYRDADGNPVPIPAISIATRPDCLPDDVVSYLADLNTRTDVTVELGLQSAKDETLTRIRRGHSFAAFLDGYTRLKNAGIAVCVHIINGLPGENVDDMLFTAKTLAALKPDFLKIHMLHVLKNTPLAGMWEAGEVPLLSLSEYADIVIRQLSILPPETVICRLTGDGAGGELLAPLWTKNKRAVIAAIDRGFCAADGWQGKLY
ncbi:MAG: TIGR01212 family radical SAM protein [Clostridia bacterium]|nr:TIGR01212 family radical SAM protein [Clostridia bacterium]